MFGRNNDNMNYQNPYMNDGYDNSNFQIRYSNLKSQYENEKNKREYWEKEYKKLKSMVENLCKSIVSNQYNYNQLGGNSILIDMDIYKMIEFTTTDFVNQKIETKNDISNLMMQLTTYQEIIKNLKEQLTQNMLSNNSDISSEDLQQGNIINNTNNNSMDVLESNVFSMDNNIPKVENPNPNEKQKISVDIFGNIISNNQNQSNSSNNDFISQNKNNNVSRNENVQVNNNIPNNQGTVSQLVEDPSSQMGNIFGNVNFGNNTPTQTQSQVQPNIKNEKEQMPIKPINPIPSPVFNTNNIINNKNNQEVNRNNNVNSNVQNNTNKNSNVSNTPKLTLENVDSYMEAMTPIMWDILEVIGDFGYATTNDIFNEINKEKEKYTKSSLLNTVSGLTKMNILLSNTVSTGHRGFQILKLTNKGETMFKTKFAKEPVESEIDKIIRDHDNVTHGYTIKDAKNFMIDVFKCTNVTMERQKVSIKLPNGKTYIPDIVAVHPKKYKMYIEVELGNTPQNDFNDKCNKMLQVTKHFYFVSDVEENRKKVESEVSSWIVNVGGKEKVSGVVIYTTTMTKLKKGEWSSVLKF